MGHFNEKVGKSRARLKAWSYSLHNPSLFLQLWQSFVQWGRTVCAISKQGHNGKNTKHSTINNKYIFNFRFIKTLLIHIQNKHVIAAVFKGLTHCILGNFACILSSADFFQNQLFWKILWGIPSESVANRLDTDQARHFVGPDLVPNCLQRLSADNSCH